MKKFLFLSILTISHIFGAEKQSTLNIYISIFSALAPVSPVVVYTDDKNLKMIFKDSEKIQLADSLDYADIALVTGMHSLKSILSSLGKQKDNSSKPLVIVTDFRFLKYSERIAGAFYWRKGRSQLVFIEKRLRQFNIALPKEYHKYLIGSL